jgi:hypothetical protein
VRGHDVTADDQSRFVGYFGPLHVRADGMNDGLLEGPETVVACIGYERGDAE